MTRKVMSLCIVLAAMAGIAVAQPAIVNGSFEADAKYEEWPHYHQSNEITGWVHEGAGWGINESDGPFHPADGPVPDGTQIVFMQGGGTLSQTLTGFVDGQAYVLSCYVNARPCCSDTNEVDMQVTLGGVEIHPLTRYPTQASYHFVEIPFTYVASTMGSGVLSFIGAYAPGGDFTFLIDHVQLDLAGAPGEPTWDNWPVYKATSAPVVDGVVNPSEYGSAVLSMTPATMAANGGSNNVSGATDFSAEMACDYYFAWNSTALYIGCVVTDDSINWGPNQGAALNGTDAMQIAFNHTNNPDVGPNDDPGLTIHDVSPGQVDNHDAAAYWQHWPGEVGYPASFPNSQFAATVSGTNYSAELAIQWSDFTNMGTPQIGTVIGYLALLIDVDEGTLNQLWWNNGDGANTIGGPGSAYNSMTLMDSEVPPTEPPVVFRFDCDTDGFGPTNNNTVDHTIGYLVVSPTGGDPHTMVGASIAGNTLTEFGAVIEVQNAPDANPFQCAMYWFADGGHGRAPFNIAEGANVVRFNVPATKDAGAASWDDSVTAFRLDLPEIDSTPFVNAGTVFLIDAIALSEFDDFVPDPWTLDDDCDNDGLSNDYEDALGTDPKDGDSDDDGVSDGIEVQFGSDPLDPLDFVQVPVMNYLGMGLTALLLAAAALVLAHRRRSASH